MSELKVNKVTPRIRYYCNYWDSGEHLALAGNIGLGGATPTTSGTGITFPATASASTNANTLDDYEEGWNYCYRYKWFSICYYSIKMHARLSFC
jgi:hypothetical protein